MFSLSPIKILIIVAVVLLLLGPDKLPEVAHRIGSAWRSLKRLQERVEAEVREAIPDLPSSGDIARIARSPVNLLNQLADRVDAKEDDETAAKAPPIVPEPQPIIIPDITPVIPKQQNTTLPPDPSLN